MPAISLRELGEYGILRDWPNLKPGTYYISSLETPNYNCVAWVNRITYQNVDFSLDEEGDLQIDPYYLTSYPYIEYFEGIGFELCGNDCSLEEGIEKIAIFEWEQQFKHVAIQLDNGYWASKMGDFEDIVHYRIESVEGHMFKSRTFGRPAFYMKRKRPIDNIISSTVLVPLF